MGKRTVHRRGEIRRLREQANELRRQAGILEERANALETEMQAVAKHSGGRVAFYRDQQRQAAAEARQGDAYERGYALLASQREE